MIWPATNMGKLTTIIPDCPSGQAAAARTIGGKAVGLCRLVHAGFPVPPAAVLHAQACAAGPRRRKPECGGTDAVLRNAREPGGGT